MYLTIMYPISTPKYPINNINRQINVIRIIFWILLYLFIIQSKPELNNKIIEEKAGKNKNICFKMA